MRVYRVWVWCWNATPVPYPCQALLLKWEDKLIGFRINIVTDHEALQFLQTQRRLSSRQMRWMEYLSRFNYDIHYVKGALNKVADALSRYYESDTWYDVHPITSYVDADVCLDPDHEDLPTDRSQEVRKDAVKVNAIRVIDDIQRRRSERLLERQED